MKQLGPTLWHGEHDLIRAMWKNQDILESQRIKKEAELIGLDPSDKYWRIIRDEWKRPWRYREGRYGSFHNFFRLREYGLAVLQPVDQETFPDIDECNRFLIQLKSLYIVDSKRGKGIGREILNDMKAVSDRSGCGIILYVAPFGFDAGNETVMGMRNWEELEKAAVFEERDILYYSKKAYGSVATFYEDSGFIHMRLDSPKSSPESKKEIRDFHFAYLPGSLEKRYRDRLKDRLNFA
jgi:GNAT superfamily N-acetyltransferase